MGLTICLPARVHGGMSRSGEHSVTLREVQSKKEDDHVNNVNEIAHRERNRTASRMF